MHQVRVGGVGDRVHVELGHVGLSDLELRHDGHILTRRDRAREATPREGKIDRDVDIAGSHSS
jgi:hypothetical protein